MRRICNNCDFYKPNNTEAGQCRKNPPIAFPLYKQLTVLIDTQIGSVFPEVSKEDWCGGHDFKGMKQEVFSESHS